MVDWNLPLEDLQQSCYKKTPEHVITPIVSREQSIRNDNKCTLVSFVIRFEHFELMYLDEEGCFFVESDPIFIDGQMFRFCLSGYWEEGDSEYSTDTQVYGSLRAEEDFQPQKKMNINVHRSVFISYNNSKGVEFEFCCGTGLYSNKNDIIENLDPARGSDYIMRRELAQLCEDGVVEFVVTVASHHRIGTDKKNGDKELESANERWKIYNLKMFMRRWKKKRIRMMGLRSVEEKYRPGGLGYLEAKRSFERGLRTLRLLERNRRKSTFEL